MKNHYITKIIFSVCLVYSFSFAQNSGPEAENLSFFHGSRMNTGITFAYWNYNDLNFIETALPVYYSMDLNEYIEGLALDLVTTPTIASYINPEFVTSDNLGNLIKETQKQTLFRFAQTKIRGSYNIKNFVLLTAGFQIPAGSNNINTNKQNVLGMLSMEECGWKVTNLLTGFNFNLTASTSYEIFEDFVIGASFGYLFKGTYTPVDKTGITDNDLKKYNPGDQFTITGGCDYTAMLAGTPVKFMGDVVLLLYGKDRNKSETNNELYHSGPGFGINLRSSFKTRSGLRNITMFSMYLWGISEDLQSDTETNIGNNYSLVDHFYFNNIKKVTPFITGKIRLFTADNIIGTTFMTDPFGKAFIGGLGGGMKFNLSRNMNLRSNVLINLGGKEGESLFGIEAGGMVEIIF